jgi:hypothetical protein
MLTGRLEVLIDEDRYSRLEQRARQRGTSVATLVREAINASFRRGSIGPPPHNCFWTPRSCRLTTGRP